MIAENSDMREKVNIKNSRYFQIINIHEKEKLALYVPSGSHDFENEKVLLFPPDQERSLGQVWQIVEVDPLGGRRKDLFELVHTRSTLVLTKLSHGGLFRGLFRRTENNEVRLRFGEWNSNQLFYLEKVNEEDYPNMYRFSSHENRKIYLFYDGYLRLEEIHPDDDRCHWEVKACFDNSIINRSCYLDNAYSSLVIDVPSGSLKPGTPLIQYPLNNRFNQRFNLYRSGQYYRIANLGSKLFLTTPKKPLNGNPVKQEIHCDELYQMWILEYQGKNLYLIRSAQNSELMLGIKDKEFKHESPIILTNNENFSLWRIVGSIPV